MLSFIAKKTNPVFASTKSLSILKQIHCNSLKPSASNQFNCSTFPFTTRQYSSLRLVTNFKSEKKFLLVAEKKTPNNSRKMSTTPVNLKLVKAYDNIVKSSQDQRLYRGLLLDNQLKCLLISDPSTDRSAASVDVHSGYLVDPKEFPGLAHFCEHMLFMGSTKYPGENMFSKFIEDHAGCTNAYTSNENTNYHFEIATDNFKEALDIFAQFFISPLFDSSSVDREINAVDSENQKNLQSDGWRLDQLDKSTSRADHPYSKFGTGNLKTLKLEPEKLGLNVREALLDFHSKHYSANLMTLCLLGKESLDELQSYAVNMFSDIPNKNLPLIDFDKDPYKREGGVDVLYVVPVQDLRQLSLSWVIPDSRDHYQANPANYLSHLIGHEGEGSLLSELKKKGWCNSLYAGSRREARGFQFFNVTVDLSEEGGENIQEILKNIFQYLNMLKSEKAHKWIFEEMRDLGKVKFNFKDKEKPINYVSNVSADIHIYQMHDLLTTGYYLTQFEPQMIESLFDYLTPDKMKVGVVSKKYQGKTDQVEPWYGTEYKIEKLANEDLEVLKSCATSEAFQLPVKNSFIPSDLSLVKHEATEQLPNFPRIIHSSQLARLWYKEDTKFLLPKAYLKFELRNPIVYFDPVHLNMTNLFIELLRDALTEFAYAAELAGLKYNVSPSNYGLNVSFSGFNDKMNVLLETIFAKMASFKVDPQRFSILKESFQRNLMNFEAEQPYSHSVYFMTLMLSEKGWTKQQLLDAINDFTVDDLQQFVGKLLTQNVFIESIMYGNLTQQKALEYLKIVEETLKNTSLRPVQKIRPLQPIHAFNFRQVALPEACNGVFLRNNKIHKTTSVEVYFQCGPQSSQENALVELFCQAISEACFNVLRTQEQLGYIVFSGVRIFGGVQGVRVIVQSDRPPSYLDERIENFLKLTKESFEKMSDDEFKQHVEALTLTKLEEPKKMAKQCDIYWDEITSHQYHFDRENVEVEELKKLTKADLIEFFNKLIDAEAKNRRKLAVYVYPPEMNTELNKDSLKATVIENIHEWQSGLALYPLPKPYTKLD